MIRRLTAVLAAVPAAVLAAASLALPAASSAAPMASTGPSVVEVPIEGTLEVRPGEAWRFASCDALLAASALVTHCSPESFTVTGPPFDAGIEPVRVPVVLVYGATELTVDYVIRLAEPSAPDAPDTTIGQPLAAGAVSLIPISDLSLDCGLCSRGESTIEIRSVEPQSAGVARVTGQHLVFAAAPEARGQVEIDLRVRDDIGTASKTFRVNAHVSAAPATPLLGAHIQRSRGAVRLAAADLAVQPLSAARLMLDFCGPALHGSVRCTRAGEIEYEPPADAEIAPYDQFSVRLLTEDGRQVLASVTLTDDTAPVAAAGGANRAKLELSLPRPAGEADEASRGATTRFSEAMDRIGAL